ncbi:hypothetical protein [Geodermatophilus amargosae]|uniref:hypothetical protein n=1 Tax=Geodermatophilus amargosae TaxID=1296565 RepID=UPI001C31B691|nr:hypothetical protein [Geodermatophilus amargosae]
MPRAVEAGLWGLLGGAALVLGALVAWFVRVPRAVIAVITAVTAGAILTMVADTMIPEAFERTRTRTWTGLITTSGFLVAFAAIERLGA